MILPSWRKTHNANICILRENSSTVRFKSRPESVKVHFHFLFPVRRVGADWTGPRAAREFEQSPFYQAEHVNSSKFSVFVLFLCVLLSLVYVINFILCNSYLSSGRLIAVVDKYTVICSSSNMYIIFMCNRKCTVLKTIIFERIRLYN